MPRRDALSSWLFRRTDLRVAGSPPVACTTRVRGARPAGVGFAETGENGARAIAAVDGCSLTSAARDLVRGSSAHCCPTKIPLRFP